MRELLIRYRFLLLAIVLMLSSVIFYSYNLQKKDSTTFFERSILTFSAPFQVGIDGVADFTKSIWNNYFWLVDTRQRNISLDKENQLLRSQLLQVEEVSLQNERLRELLAFVDELDHPALPAQIIGEDPSPWSRTIVIDKGANSGLKAGLPVVAAQGVVGRIIKVAANSSRVMLVSDSSSNIAALVQRTRTRGIVHGLGGNMSIKYAARNADIKVGDLIVTSGMGGVFPKGLPLGSIKTIEKRQFGFFQQVEVIPAVNFSYLEELMVMIEMDK